AVDHELRDIARLNALFGGTRAVVRELAPFLARGAGRGDSYWTLLDVGTGLGDIPRAAARAARRHGLTLRLVGVARNRTAPRLARTSDPGVPLASLLAGGGVLPLPSRSAAVIVESPVLRLVPRTDPAPWV